MKIQIEFANTGYLAVENTDLAIQRLTEISDNSLWGSIRKDRVNRYP